MSETDQDRLDHVDEALYHLDMVASEEPHVEELTSYKIAVLALDSLREEVA